MPPYTAAASARPPQSKSDRPTSATSRIIPAVPLAFSRPPRASHPVTATATATGHGNTPAQSETPKLGVVVNGSEAENKSDAAAAEEPTTSGLEHHTPTMKERHDVGTAEQGVASGTDNGLVTPGDAQGQLVVPQSAPRRANRSTHILTSPLQTKLHFHQAARTLRFSLKTQLQESHCKLR